MLNEWVVKGFISHYFYEANISRQDEKIRGRTMTTKTMTTTRKMMHGMLRRERLALAFKKMFFLFLIKIPFVFRAHIRIIYCELVSNVNSAYNFLSSPLCVYVKHLTTKTQ
jgi:hypothetical protein